MSATQDKPSSGDSNTMKIFVKDAAGDVTTTLDVSPSTSIATVKSLLAQQSEASTATESSSSSSPSSAATPPKTVRLVYADTQLDNPDSTLQDYNVTASSTLNLRHSPEPTEAAAPAPKPKPAMSTPTKSASKKPRCTFKSCNAFSQRVVGDCGFCGGHFCGKHRLLESHACSGLEDCKDEARERNKERLETERTVVVRGV